MAEATNNPTRLFLHYLSQLDALLRQVAAYDSTLVDRRLHPEMAPLLQQARNAIGFATRTCCPLAGRAIVSFDNGACTLANVLAQLHATTAYLGAMPDSVFAGMDNLCIDTTAGFAELTMDGNDYWLLYAVPNFFFHYTMVYAIARQAGVPLGKADYDGFHHYPLGFVF